MGKDKKYILTGAAISPYDDPLEGFSKVMKSINVAIEIQLKENSGVDVSDVKESAKNRIKVKSSISDVVRIFEAMKEADIISNGKTEVSQIADIFFNEALDKKKFESTYNARKSDTVEQKRNSYSKSLEEFIKILILKSFSKKDRTLENFIRFIEAIQKNRGMEVK